MTIWHVLLLIKKVCCENAENMFSYRRQAFGVDKDFLRILLFCGIGKKAVFVVMLQCVCYKMLLFALFFALLLMLNV